VTADAGGAEDAVYLTLEGVLEVYAAIIDGDAVQAADQLRSRESLEGAVGRPESYAHYEGADLALQPAVLAHGIAETQAFIDGNKRAALVSMLTFLEINGHRLAPSHHTPRS
jgi:prophage maintenance system killer protein